MKNKTIYALILLILFSLVILIAKKTPVVNSFAGFAQKVFNYPRLFFYKTKININQYNASSSDLEKIKQENVKLVQKMADYEKVKSDNNALRSQFESGADPMWQIMPSRVIGFLGRSYFPDSLIIDKGEQDGLQVGSGVIFGKNLIGKVQKVSKYYSKIILVTNKDFSILAKTSSSNALGVIKGEEDFLLLDNVLITDNISDSDIIFTRGEVNDKGLGIPPDIIIGKVSSVYKQDNKPFQNAKVNSLVDFSKLTIVFVIKSL